MVSLLVAIMALVGIVVLGLIATEFIDQNRRIRRLERRLDNAYVSIDTAPAGRMGETHTHYAVTHFPDKETPS